ncbi:MAG TPA: GH1 family beta-glucosidase [Thermoanaerobaculia bacterium]
MARSPFPAGFLWGAATSAYQVEGSPLADGAGASVWHRFSHQAGRIADGTTGDVACDHYRRWREDVALMAALGLTAYRFSVSWGRVQPHGRGAANPAGLDFYRRLVEALRDAGIAPLATLYHWDLPAALDDRGGWLDRDVAGRFADYAEICGRALDGVDLWATLNEPWVVADAGYRLGVLAPGRRSPAESARALHNQLRAHALGVAALRSVRAAGIGVAVNLEPKHPASERAEDRAAAERADAYVNRHVLDPLLLGRYPEELAAIYGDAWSVEHEREAAALAAPIDWLGINYYTRGVVRHEPTAWAGAAAVRQEGALPTEMGWEVYPPGLEETLRGVAERYPPLPLYVTENGAAFADPPTAGLGGIDEPLRTSYLRDHLGAVARAIAAGVDVRGYFAWSLLDNFEWAHGFTKRFGLVHVDFATQARTPKASARFYADVVRSGGAALG